MSNIRKYKDITVYHPGFYLENYIKDMKISQAELAKRLEVWERTLSLFIDGQIDISDDLAKRLSIVFGTSIQFWFNLQHAFEQKLVELVRAKYIDK